MIATDTIVNTSTTVVYVGSPAEPVPESIDIDPQMLTQFIELPEIQPNPDGLVLSSMRNQLVATINPLRLQFQDRSQEEPARPDFTSRVIGIMDQMRNSIGLTPTAVGIIFEIRAGSDSTELPSQELKSLVKDDLFAGTRYETIGASLRVWYTHGGRRYDLRVEPVGNQFDGQGYYGRLHVHIELDEQNDGSEEWLSQALRKEYNDLKRVLSRINEQAGRQRDDNPCIQHRR